MAGSTNVGAPRLSGVDDEAVGVPARLLPKWSLSCCPPALHVHVFFACDLNVTPSPSDIHDGGVKQNNGHTIFSFSGQFPTFFQL